MMILKEDVNRLGQEIERKIALIDLKGTDQTVTEVLTILRCEFAVFFNEQNKR